MATEYYMDWEGEKTPLPPGIVKIARLIAKLRGEDMGKVLNRIVNELAQLILDKDPAKVRAKVEADARYCEAEGLDLETFRRARNDANAESAYRQFRRLVSGLTGTSWGIE